ncbi:MAG: DUF1343 domain-containing protein [Bacteroidetes bacterium]|nr:DUF1343 domain-containing protein [Bacteroidota bacterium]
MKYSCANIKFYALRKYGKLLLVESVLVLLLAQCSLISSGERDIISVNDDNILVREENKVEDGGMEVAADRMMYLGIERLPIFIDSLQNKCVAVVSNQTSKINGTHLVDTLLMLGVNVTRVFAPEHGFRGTADAGEHVETSVDAKTGIPIISLYGNNKKPTAEQLEDIDVVVYDIQDVGVRFYTYISTLHYVMQACAENKKTIYILDRPNPNGHYIDGPVREPAYKSFVGMHPVPIVYGMTIGEYALMVNGEYWLGDSLQCEVRVVPCKNYYHKMRYELEIPPSPNLRSSKAVSLYPSLCLFEATAVSVGRGTDRPFEWFGHPLFPQSSMSFVPVSQEGAKNPMYENQICYAFDIAESEKGRQYQLNLSWIKMAYELIKDSTQFVTNQAFFNRLAGNNVLINQIREGKSEKEIRASWKPGLDEFRKIRSKYLIYD